MNQNRKMQKSPNNFREMKIVLQFILVLQIQAFQPDLLRNRYKSFKANT